MEFRRVVAMARVDGNLSVLPVEEIAPRTEC